MTATLPSTTTTTTTAAPTVGRRARRAGRVLTVLLVAFLLFDAVIHITLIDVVREAFEEIGLATYYDVSPDGQRFLCVIPSASDTSFAPITVVLNWQAALHK